MVTGKRRVDVARDLRFCIFISFRTLLKSNLNYSIPSLGRTSRQGSRAGQGECTSYIEKDLPTLNLILIDIKDRQWNRDSDRDRDKGGR
jgi:hypothetical protein